MGPSRKLDVPAPPRNANAELRATRIRRTIGDGGATRSQLKKLLARKRKGFSGKIVTEAELRRVLIKSLPKKTKMQLMKRKSIKRRTRSSKRKRRK